MLAGSEGLGGIEFESSIMAQQVGTIALLIILFSGGLETQWAPVRSVLAPGLLLSTVGVAMTTLLVGSFAWLVLGSFSSFHLGATGISFLEALLIGAIVSSTDAAAVFSLFRTSPIKPKVKLRYLLEFESGSNDPMAVLLTTTLLGLITFPEGGALWDLFGELLTQYALGVIIGCAIGAAGAWIINRKQLSLSGLYPVLALAHGFIAFGLAETLGGNGFLAVYAAGLVLGNRLKAYKANILDFHEGISWLMQIGLFIMLGLLVFPSRLVEIAGVSITLALFLMFIARPISVALCLLPFGQKKSDIAYISWGGLRGSVPIVLATFPATFGLEADNTIFHLIFFIVCASVLIQGMTLVRATKWLGVSETAPQAQTGSE